MRFAIYETRIRKNTQEYSQACVAGYQVKAAKAVSDGVNWSNVYDGREESWEVPFDEDSCENIVRVRSKLTAKVYSVGWEATLKYLCGAEYILAHMGEA